MSERRLEFTILLILCSLCACALSYGRNIVESGNELGERSVASANYPVLPSLVLYPGGEVWDDGISTLELKGPLNLGELVEENSAYSDLRTETLELEYGRTYESDEVPLVPGGVYEYCYTITDPWGSAYGGEPIAMFALSGEQHYSDIYGSSIVAEVISEDNTYGYDGFNRLHIRRARIRLLKVDL